MAKTIPLRRWTTKDEIDFLRHLGTHRERPGLLSRRDLLRLYRRSVRGKKYWGFVDRRMIEDYLTLELGKEAAS